MNDTTIKNKFVFSLRCVVEECESLDSAKYNENWVKDVLPGKVSEITGLFVPEHCLRYKFENTTNETFEGICQPHWFSHETIPCNRWVFEEGERTIVNDVSFKQT